MSEIITSEVQFKSGYKARIFLVPVTVINPAAGMNVIKLTVSGNKTLPGIAEGETWTFSTDDPEQEIAETVAGKFGGVSKLDFEVPYDPFLQGDLRYRTRTRKCFLYRNQPAGERTSGNDSILHARSSRYW